MTSLRRHLVIAHGEASERLTNQLHVAKVEARGRCVNQVLHSALINRCVLVSATTYSTMLYTAHAPPFILLLV
jgi:hypothetical protein